jgi:hypothetical protein
MQTAKNCYTIKEDDSKNSNKNAHQNHWNIHVHFVLLSNRAESGCIRQSWIHWIRNCGECHVFQAETRENTHYKGGPTEWQK